MCVNEKLKGCTLYIIIQLLLPLLFVYFFTSIPIWFFIKPRHMHKGYGGRFVACDKIPT